MKRIKLIVMLSILSLLTQQALGFFVPINCAMQSDHAEMKMESVTSDAHTMHMSHEEDTDSDSENMSDESILKSASGCQGNDNCSKACLMHAFFLPAADINVFTPSVVSVYASVIQQSPFSVLSFSFKPPILS